MEVTILLNQLLKNYQIENLTRFLDAMSPHAVQEIKDNLNQLVDNDDIDKQDLLIIADAVYSYYYLHFELQLY